MNFPLDQFGVVDPALKKLARTPKIEVAPEIIEKESKVSVAQQKRFLWQAEVRNISGLGDRSAYGLPSETGVLVLNVPEASPAARYGFQKEDVILTCNGKPVSSIDSLLAQQAKAAGDKLTLKLQRKQASVAIEMVDTVFAAIEYRANTDFRSVFMGPASAAHVAANAPGTMNEPLAILTDGSLARNYGPVFGNGVLGGMYKMDLGEAKTLIQVNTFSYNENGNRGSQRFVLYGSASKKDPGWQVQDRSIYTPRADVVAENPGSTDFVATSVRRYRNAPLGQYRWLVWAVSPVTETAGGENTAFQEMQVLAGPLD